MMENEVPTANCLYIDPTSKKLCWKDAAGAVHPLH